MTRPFSIVALLLLGFNAAAASDATLLESIAHVESGHNRKAIGKAGERGMYQVGKAAWDDASARLKAEVERLTKAGDTLVAAYCMGDKNIERWAEYPVVREWRAAKGELP